MAQGYGANEARSMCQANLAARYPEETFGQDLSGAGGQAAGESFSDYLLRLAGTQGGGTMPGPMEPGGHQWMEEVYGPEAGYLSALGLYGRQYQTPYQQYLANRYQQLAGLWGARQAMAVDYPAMGQSGLGYLSEWAPQYARDPFAMYGMAQNMLRQTMGMSPEQRAGYGLTYEGGGLENLMQMGLRPQYGRFGAGYVAGQMPVERERWIQQYPTQEGPTFLDYLRQRYGLAP